MISSLKPYPQMKDSGVPWLGEIPEHWGLQRGKWLFRKMDRAARESDEVVTCFRDGVVTLRKNRRIRGFTESIKEIGYQGIRRGDLVIHAMDAFAGAIGVSESEGKGTPVYSVCEPVSIANSHYFAHMLREMARSQWVQALSKGIRERSTDFRFETFAAQFLSLPPLPEQAAIVKFIDHFDRKIWRYIRAKQKMIKILEEQKRAIIHSAVTGQVDIRTGKPYPAYKPSGVEWLGDIPKHWELVPNRSFLTLRNEVVRERSKNYTLLSLTLRGVIARDMENPAGKWPSNFDAYQVVEPNDLIFCLFDIDETPRFVGLSKLNGMITGAYKVFRCKNSEVAEWGYMFYLAMDFDKRLKPAYTGLRKVIQKGTFLGLKLPIPPYKERVVILGEIANKTAGINPAISRFEREIELLREYRIRLIADVVTGKLDVREAAVRLPDETEELEPLEAADELIDADDPVENDNLAEALPEEVEA